MGLALALRWHVLIVVLTLCSPLGMGHARGQTATQSKGSRVIQQTFGEIAPNQSARLWTVTNSQGLVLKVTDYGARLVALECPDRDGRPHRADLHDRALL